MKNNEIEDYFLRESVIEAFTELDIKNPTTNQIKKVIKLLQKKIKTDQRLIKQVQSLCKHEKTIESLYQFRPWDMFEYRLFVILAINYKSSK